MTAITCHVKKCVYNTDGGCKLEKIKVGKDGASMSSETMCESFTEHEGAMNACGCRKNACDISNVVCSAHSCTYNEFGKCEAKKIEIDDCLASACGCTECHTFKNE